MLRRLVSLLKAKILGITEPTKCCDTGFHTYSAYNNICYFENFDGKITLLRQRECLLCNHIESTTQDVAHANTYHRTSMLNYLNAKLEASRTNTSHPERI